jgi:hypothetical protein
VVVVVVVGRGRRRSRHGITRSAVIIEPHIYNECIKRVGGGGGGQPERVDSQ